MRILFFLLLLCNVAHAEYSINPHTGRMDKTGSGSSYSAITQLNGNIGINTVSPAYTLDVKGNLNVDGAVYGGSFNATPTSDPYQTFDVSTVGDSDFYIGVTSDNAGTSANDTLRFGTGLVSSDNTFFIVSTSGSPTFGNGTADTNTLVINGSGLTNYTQTLSSISTGTMISAITGLRQTYSGSGTLFNITGQCDGGNSSACNGLGITVTYASDSTASNITLPITTTLTNSSSMTGTNYGLRSSSTKSGAGTTTGYYGVYSSPSTVSAGAVTNNYALGFDGKQRLSPQSLSIAGSGAKTDFTFTPTASYVEASCQNVNGCHGTFGSTGILSGTPVTMVNMGSNTISFDDTVGLANLAGSIDMGIYDSLNVISTTNGWVENSRSNN